MKSKFFLFNLIIFCLAGIIFSSSKTVAAQNNLQKAIKTHIEKVSEDASEYEEARKIVYGDVDGDGVKGRGCAIYARRFRRRQFVGTKPCRFSEQKRRL